jgi:hypothetical protein
MRPLDHRLKGSTLLILSLSMIACSPSQAGSLTTSPGQGDAAAASSGVCLARLALPDATVAARAFTDLAHDALHRLAADTRLSRSAAAAILETMQRSETDLGHAPISAELATDLDALQDATDAGLTALGEVVPPCAR